MKPSILFPFLLSIAILSCDKDEPVAIQGGCTDQKYTRFATFTDVEAKVSAQGNLFLITAIGKDGSSIRWFPCNLPSQLQKDRLTIKVSGHQLYFPGMEAASMVGIPFEITKIVQ